MNVTTPSTPMRSNPSEISELETECLFGESLTILDKHKDWYYCKLLTDNYCGWVQKSNLGKMNPCTHRVVSKRTFLFKDKDVKSGCINYLPLGGQVSVKIVDDEWTKIYLFENSNHRFAYVPSHHIIEKNAKIEDWVAISEKLIGCPYVWGGRNSIGLDCSALLQLSYQTYGEDIPRNTNNQLSINKETIHNLDMLERGFVVFWQGHVGIMVDKLNCIHANAFHMEVSIEPLAKIISRIGKDNPVIKIMNFNSNID
ncbi:C40 family peptidase [Alphaproteobacteria bacterium]|nr:C40 family peptidase [Alphaproteobacteria bacterium]